MAKGYTRKSKTSLGVRKTKTYNASTGKTTRSTSTKTSKTTRRTTTATPGKRNKITTTTKHGGRIIRESHYSGLQKPKKPRKK